MKDEIKKIKKEVKETVYTSKEVVKEKDFYVFEDKEFTNKKDAERYMKLVLINREYDRKKTIVQNLKRIELLWRDCLLITNDDEFSAFKQLFPTTEEVEIPSKYPFWISQKFEDGGDYDKDRRYWFFLTEDDLTKALADMRVKNV
jgi:hypothetical protein